jgi:hypothetical protein
MGSGKRVFERLGAENSARQQASILVQQASKVVCEIRPLRSLLGAGEGSSLRRAGGTEIENISVARAGRGCGPDGRCQDERIAVDMRC